MFWSYTHPQAAQLREELRLRLRVAADLATLGAYELSEHDDEDAAYEAADHVVREEPPKRVLLFAKVAPVCPHSAPVERACSARQATKARAPRRAARQRGGAVQAPEQPCVCAAARVPSPGA